MKKGINKIYLVLIVFLMLSWVQSIQAIDLQEWFTEEALRLNEIKIQYDSRLSATDLMTCKQAHDRVYWLDFYSKELNYVCPAIHPRRVWKDSFCIVTVESWFVNWRETDGGKGFGWGSILWETCEYVARKYGWNWDEEKKHISGSDRLQGKYIIGYYYLMLKWYSGNRHQAIVAYNKGFGVKAEPRWENYFFLVYGKLVYYESVWADINERGVC